MNARIAITLIPSIQKDEETGLFTAKFAEFPAAMVFDETSELAEARLLSALEALIANERQYIIDTVNRNYNTTFKSDTCTINLSKRTVFKDHSKTQEIEVEFPMVA